MTTATKTKPKQSPKAVDPRPPAIRGKYERNAFVAGRNAAVAGRPDSDNPYSLDASEGEKTLHLHWNDGYDAFHAEAKARKKGDVTADDADSADEGTKSNSSAEIGEICGSNSPAVPSPTPPDASLEHDHLVKIKAARAVVADRERTYLSLKSRAKQAKEAFEEAVADLTAVIDDGEEILPLFDGLPQTAEAKQATADATDATDEAGQAAEPDTAWRQAPAAELEAFGLRPGVIDKLVEAGCPTIGEIEDLRASHKGLQSIPGIGQKKISEIEDAIVAWLTRHRDAKVFAAAAEPATGANENPDRAYADDRAHVAQVLARADVIEDSRVFEPQCAARMYWEDGKKAYEDERPPEDCPWTPGESQDDWLRGWLTGFTTD